ncbi:cytochrome c biogenesis protein CcdC [Bacillus shivajii]|uniref:CcdC family protein n=1 Tax=Bacillus shivajii TaxID=1983719 RepID=UPI001CFB8DFA|nr:cytochrome c biogenesis protein CcdC [Bacillus shivajii]UCZ51620.1 cytochrome c biogenesis protein CcdC [Bacillus shivajii]
MFNMYATIFTVLAVIMALIAIFVRMKAMKKPANVKKIIIPPIAMSTGFFMFLYPPTRPPAWEVILAFAVGMVFSIVLIKTSSFIIKDNDIYMKRSIIFPFILFGLLAVRLTFKLTFGIHFEYEVLAGLFFILAFGMILPWRVAMLVKFKKVEREFALKLNNRNRTWNLKQENPTS